MGPNSRTSSSKLSIWQDLGPEEIWVLKSLKLICLKSQYGAYLEVWQ